MSLHCRSSSYILDINPLSNIWFANIFFHLVRLPFHCCFLCCNFWVLKYLPIWVLYSIMGFCGGSDCKESACKVGDLGSIPDWEDPLEKGKITKQPASSTWTFRLLPDYAAKRQCSSRYCLRVMLESSGVVTCRFLGAISYLMNQNFWKWLWDSAFATGFASDF